MVFPCGSLTLNNTFSIIPKGSNQCQTENRQFERIATLPKEDTLKRLVMKKGFLLKTILMKGILLSLAFVIIGSVTPALARRVYYVRKPPNGNDANNGLSPDRAWATIGRAASTMVAGDIVYVGAGVYYESVQPANSGTATARISYIADTDGSKTGDRGDVIVDGGGTLTPFYLNGRSYITIQGFVIRNSVWSGIGVARSPNLEIVGNTIHNNADSAIYLNRDSTNCEITGNTVYSNDLDGTMDGVIRLRYDCNNCLINRNIIYSNGHRGILIQDRSHRVRIENNIIHSNPRFGITIMDSIDAVIVNNTIYNNRGGIDFVRSTGGTLFNNIIWDSSSMCCIFVCRDSTTGFASNYNNLYATGRALVGFWAGTYYRTLTAW